MKAGVKEIAKQAGVAISTVSHVLNGTAPLSKDVRDRVLQAARQLGYLEQRRVRASISALTDVVLAIAEDATPQIDTNMFTVAILNSLRQECDRRSIRLIPAVGVGQKVDVAAVRDILKAETPQGLILYTDDRPELIQAVAGLGVPTVLINGEDPTMSVDSVVPANRFAGLQATRHLLQLGHRNILHMTWHRRQTIRRRLEGFMDAFREINLPLPADAIIEADSFEPEHAEQLIDRLMARDGGLRGATAIFCASDNLALGTLRALERHGVGVPDNVSVIGFDDIMLGELSRPPLTTIHVPLDQLGPAALGLIEQRILANSPTRAAMRVELGCRLIQRATVRSLNGA
jgi:DNA-binding LacI/PurR family transcriptional regulator